jgi:hypothetical protein
MSWLAKTLRRIGVLPPFTEDDILNAENENALRNVKTAKSAVDEQYSRQHLSADHLKNVLRDARSRVNSFAEFERKIRDVTRAQRRDAN